MIVHYIVSFVCAVLFVILLAIASGGHASPIMMEKLQHSGLVNFVFALLGSFAYHVVFTNVAWKHGREDRSLDGGCPGGRLAVQIQGRSDPELGYFVDALFFGIIGYSAMKDTVEQKRHGDTWAHTIVCKRTLISREKLRGADRFVMALIFALMADAALMIVGLLFAVLG